MSKDIVDAIMDKDANLVSELVNENLMGSIAAKLEATRSEISRKLFAEEKDMDKEMDDEEEDMEGDDDEKEEMEEEVVSDDGQSKVPSPSTKKAKEPKGQTGGKKKIESDDGNNETVA